MHKCHVSVKKLLKLPRVSFPVPRGKSTLAVKPNEHLQGELKRALISQTKAPKPPRSHCSRQKENKEGESKDKQGDVTG